jgi:fluoroacetyl-CoA thioesterase
MVPRPMADSLEVGIESVAEFEVDGALLTDVDGTLAREVLSTPAMVMMMERTASTMVRPLLGPGKATVGFEVCVKHVAGAPKGAHCTARARLDEIVDGRKLRFAVEVVGDDGRTIGVGTHERRVIDVDGAA